MFGLYDLFSFGLLQALRDRFSLVHIILSDSCGVPKL